MGTDDGKTSLTNEKITYHCHSESNSVAFISGKLAAIVRKHYRVDEFDIKFHGCDYRSIHRRSSIKEVFLKILQNLQENACSRVTILIRLQTSGMQLY